MFGILNFLAGVDQIGLSALGAGIAVLCGAGSAIGEGMICSKAIEGMTRNPEMQSKLNSTMILAVALDETTAIYALVVAILIIFMLGIPALSLTGGEAASSAIALFGI